ncbi:MAG: amidohydrolase [Defluviitaleaceae bacterium]|nr:amidohydrolase [Defluviitaleaceae bacterium]
MKDGLLLKDYNPISMLTVPITHVPKPKFPVFDFHTHIGPLYEKSNLWDDVSSTSTMVQELRERNIFGVVNLKLMWGKALDEAVGRLKGYEDFIYTFGSVDIGRLEDVDFAYYVDETFKHYKRIGVRGLKFWKNLGLGLKDSSGKYVPVDDARLKPIWEGAARYGLLVLIHVADPKCFFTPVDEKNEWYECLIEQPEWSFCRDELYTFEQLMEQQDALLANNPDTTFIIPHVGSCSEDLGFVGSQLDKHKNMYIDPSARISELGRQPYTAREFFIKYQDRILFGTDYTGSEPDAVYPYYFRFLETFDEYFRYGPDDWGYGLGRWNIYGIGLPDDVLKKIYSGNAMQLMKLK